MNKRDTNFGNLLNKKHFIGSKILTSDHVATIIKPFSPGNLHQANF